MRAHATPMISVSATAGLIEMLERAGGDPDEVFRKVGLNREAFRDTDRFIPSAAFGRLLEEAARETAEDCFGLRFGESYNPKNIGPLIYVVLNSPTVRAGIENAQRYLQVHNQGAKWSLTVQDRRAYVYYQVMPELGIQELRQYNEVGMVVALYTLRLMVGSHWSPVEVRFAHPQPADISEHLRVFGAPVLFGYGVNTFVIESEFLERQIPAADPRLYGILKRYLERVLDEMPREDGLLSCVRRIIAELMRDGDPTLSRVAKKMALSARTLERRLNESGVIFKQVIADTRRRFAINYLKDSNNTLTEIAFLLGYSELSAFTRAFKRWTGQTPMEYRRGGGRHFEIR
jgi:AraC-like DNA-binding protein